VPEKDTSEVVLYERQGALVVITLNRPEAANSLTHAVKTGLRDRLEDTVTDDEARAVLITGAGKTFCAGQDLTEHQQALENVGARAFDTIEQDYSPIIRLLTGMDKPVIAGINGVCAGAGLALALAADLRVAASSATFTAAFTAIGLTADSALSRTLPRAVGHGWAQNMLYRNVRLDADEAARIGLVHYVLASDEFAVDLVEMAQSVAAGPTRAFAATKQLLATSSDTDLDGVLAAEGTWQHELGVTQDHMEAVAAFTNKQRPTFLGR